MIEFELTDDHKALVQTVREFAQKEVGPFIKEWDEKQHFERSVLDKMAALNLLGVCIPEEYGGAGFDYIALGLVCEELEAVDTFLRVVMSVHTGLNSLTLYTWGSEAQKQKYLVPQAKGEKLATYGLTEPGAGSDVIGARATIQVCLVSSSNAPCAGSHRARFTERWEFAPATPVTSRWKTCVCRRK